jgi:UDP-glucose 4-epimerase
MSDRLALVTGGMGFLGRHVVSALVFSGYRVIGLGHGVNDAPINGFQWIDGDVNLESLKEIKETPDVIIHCAGGGSVAFANSNPFVDFSRTVDTTLAVLEYARQCPNVPRVILPSSAAIYGGAKSWPTPETELATPVSPYGIHKLIAEKICQSYARYYLVPVAIVRLFSVYGAGLRKQLLWDACCKFSSGTASFFGSGEEERDWIHVSDAVNLLLRVADFAGEDCPIYNGGSGAVVSNRELLGFLSECFSKGSAPCFSGVVKVGDPDRYHADIRTAKGIGWSPQVAWKEGVAGYAEWFKKGAI